MSSVTREAIVLPLHPAYAKLIYSGKKTVELRKFLPSRQTSIILIYETAPVSKLTGVLHLRWARRLSVSTIWRRFANQMRVTRAAFLAYVGRRKSAVLLGVQVARKYTRPIALGRATGFTSPPQTLRYARVRSTIA